MPSWRGTRLHAAIAALLLAAYPVVHGDGRSLALWSASFGLLAVGAVSVAARRHARETWRLWAAIGAGLLLSALGDVARIDRASSHGAFTGVDLLSLAAYPAFGGALLLMIARASPGRDSSSLVDAAIVTVGVAAISWVYLVRAYSEDAGVSDPERAILVVVPFLDLLLLMLAGRLLFGPGGRTRSVGMIAGALAVQLCGDTAYGIGRLNGWYDLRSPAELLWPLAFALWGLAVLHPSTKGLVETRDVAPEPTSWRRLGLLGVAAMCAPAMLVVQSLRGDARDVRVTALASLVLFGLVLIRLAQMIGEHERAVRREHILGETAALLSSARSRDTLYASAVDGALALSDDGVTAALAIGPAADMLLVDTGGPFAEQLDGMRIHLPDSSRAALEVGERVEVTVDTAFGAGLVQPAGSRVKLYPLHIGGETAGAIVTHRLADGSSGIAPGLDTLAAQVALALESMDLTDDLLAQQSEARFRSLVQHSSDLIVVLESDLTIRFHTPSAEHILGYAPQELVGQSLSTLLPPDGLVDSLGFFWEACEREGSVERELRFRRKHGGWRTVECVVNNLLDDPSVHGLVLTAHDVTDRKNLENQLSHQAFHDSLTGLANRALFSDRVTHALDRSDRSPGVVAVIFVDLDDFKTVNDSLGHAAGDELLMTVAERIQECLRPADTCSRLGGDEFAVLLEDVDRAHACAIAERILDGLAPAVRIAGSEFFVRASIGIALGTSATSTSDLLRNADVAMYKAKGEGKGRYEVFEPRMHAAALRRLELKSELQRAVAEGELEPYFQPLVSLQTGAIVGFEALVRWIHPTRGVIGPDLFIPLAEETGLIVQLGNQMLRRSSEWLGRWHQQPGYESLYVTVNLSARELAEPGLVERVQQVLEETRTLPRDLTLEITESSLMHDAEAVGRLIAQIRSLGVKIAIDDFGTGFSSLSYLHRFPVDILKVARQFVDQIGINHDSTRVAVAIVRLAKSLGLGTVAEGIEKPLQRDRLREMGCQIGQGMLFSRPIESRAVESFLRFLERPPAPVTELQRAGSEEASRAAPAEARATEPSRPGLRVVDGAPAVDLEQRSA